MSQVTVKFQRNAATWTAYGLLGILTLQIALVGPIMPYLRAEMGLTYAEGALHTSAFAIGMMASGFLVAHVDAMTGRKGVALISAFALTAFFVSLTLAPNFIVSLSSAFLMGLIGSMGVAIAPMILSGAHTDHFERSLAEANLIAYFGGLAAPIGVALASQFISWRGAALIGILTFLALAYTIHHAHLPTEQDDAEEDTSTLGLGYWAFWTVLTISVSVEFCFIVWSASYLEHITMLARETAVLGSTAFPIGMLIGRLIGIPLLSAVGPLRLATGSMILAFIGFLIFWLMSHAAFVIAGLFLAGLGLANLYATGIAMALKAAGSAMKKGAERSSIASGLAIIASPLILGALADALGLYLAYAIVPALVLIGLIAIRVGGRAI